MAGLEAAKPDQTTVPDAGDGGCCRVDTSRGFQSGAVAANVAAREGWVLEKLE